MSAVLGRSWGYTAYCRAVWEEEAVWIRSSCSEQEVPSSSGFSLEREKGSLSVQFKYSQQYFQCTLQSWKVEST